MTFFEARSVSKVNFMHVRRESWPVDRWFIVWRGVWFKFDTGGLLRVVQASDYDRGDLLATDWTTVPEPLGSCPVVPPSGPHDPGSPGPVPPGPGFPGFPADPGVPGGGGYIPVTPGPVPPPPDRRGMSVTFAGLQMNSGPSGARIIDDTSALNGQPIKLFRFSNGVWKGHIQAGIYAPDGDQRPINWEVQVQSFVYGDPVFGPPWPWAVSLYWPTGGTFVGGFLTTGGTEQPPGAPINNFYDSGSYGSSTGIVYSGTATVNN
jgi:hypothetical protein